MKGGQVPFGWQLSEIKGKSSMKERRLELAPSTSPPATVCLSLKYHMFLYQKEKGLLLYMFKMFLLFQNNSK